MRTSLFLVALTLAAGCTTSVSTGDSFGYFNQSPVPEHDIYLAEDVAKQLAFLLPPASTKLEIRQPCQDAFGKALLGLLRGKGYALQEDASPVDQTTQATSSQSAGAAPLGSTPLNYVLDTIETPALYRITLYVGEQSLSRAYQPRGALVQPVGAWMRRE